MVLKSKVKGNKFENKVAKSINSGALWFSPLDLQEDKHCIECKYTDKKGYRISLDLLESIWDKALSKNKLPYLVIGIRRNENQLFVLRCGITTESEK